MFNPRSLVYALYTHWDTVEILVRISREYAAFTSDQVLKIIAKVNPQLNYEEQTNDPCCQFRTVKLGRF